MLIFVSYFPIILLSIKSDALLLEMITFHLVDNSYRLAKLDGNVNSIQSMGEMMKLVSCKYVHELVIFDFNLASFSLLFHQHLL